MEQHAEKAQLFVERVRAFLVRAREWCTERDLTVQDNVVELNEQGMPKYHAPSLHISKDGVSLAKIEPLGAAIIGAQGRIDLIGPVARHAFLFHVGKGPGISIRAIVNGQATSETSRPMLSGIDGDDWYWIEAKVRRAKRVDESLFLDLLTDVSDYEFH
ncbi:hypothetical protein ABH944_008529 [Caballeronia udeis]|uniref:Uncharacterized protein n=1 Tax=Caballeronia udeis TaxID=1232866 RepID=A0ABW8MXP0_9BURK